MARSDMPDARRTETCEAGQDEPERQRGTRALAGSLAVHGAVALVAVVVARAPSDETSEPHPPAVEIELVGPSPPPPSPEPPANAGGGPPASAAAPRAAPRVRAIAPRAPRQSAL